MAIYGFEGKTPAIHPKAYVHPSAQVIGDVVLGEECFVGAGAIIRGDYGQIRVGDRTAVEEGCIIHAPPAETCSIGSEVTLGHGALIHGTEIGDHARIAMGVIVSFHSVVEAWVVIGDGAVVPPNSRVASGGIYMGNPAREVRKLTDRDRETSHFVVDLYANLCDRYRRGQQLLSP